MVNNNKIIKEKLRIILENKYLNIRMWSDKIHWLENRNINYKRLVEVGNGKLWFFI